MAFQIHLEEHPQYVHARGAGEHSAENALRFLEEAYYACKQRGQSNLLLEFGFTGPSLHGGAIHEVIAARSPDGASLQRIAYVDASVERGAEHMRFAETVARNRGVNVRLFRSVAEARQWLSSPAENQGR